MSPTSMDGSASRRMATICAPGGRLVCGQSAMEDFNEIDHTPNAPAIAVIRALQCECEPGRPVG